MPIDIETETLLSMNEAAGRVPGRKRGKRTHPSTIRRWCNKGVRGGVRLESVPCGGDLKTSVEAMDRFFSALAAKRGGGPVAQDQAARVSQAAAGSSPDRTSERDRQQRAARARKRLERMGAI